MKHEFNYQELFLLSDAVSEAKRDWYERISNSYNFSNGKLVCDKFSAYKNLENKIWNIIREMDNEAENEKE